MSLPLSWKSVCWETQVPCVCWGALSVFLSNNACQCPEPVWPQWNDALLNGHGLVLHPHIHVFGGIWDVTMGSRWYCPEIWGGEPLREITRSFPSKGNPWQIPAATAAGCAMVWIKDTSHLSVGGLSSWHREDPAGMVNSCHGDALNWEPKPQILELIARERKRLVISISIFVFILK